MLAYLSLRWGLQGLLHVGYVVKSASAAAEEAAEAEEALEAAAFEIEALKRQMAQLQTENNTLRGALRKASIARGGYPGASAESFPAS